MKRTIILVLTLSFGLFSCSDSGSNEQAESANKLTGALAEIPENAGIRIQGVEDGSTVSSPLKFSVALKIPEDANIDLDGGQVFIFVGKNFMKKGSVIPVGKDWIIKLPKDKKEFKIDLKPGKQVITAQYADSENRSYGYTLSHSVKIIAE